MLYSQYANWPLLLVSISLNNYLNTAPLSIYYTRHKSTINIGIAIVTIGLIYCYIKKNRCNHNNMTRVTNPNLSLYNLPNIPSSKQRVGEGILITVVSNIIRPKLTNDIFKSYISSRVQSIASQHSPNQLDTLCKQYLSNFSAQEQALLNSFQSGTLETAQGVLLYGPPGSGKSCFVHEFARKSRSLLLVVSTSRINSGYAGDGTETVAHLFQQAKSLLNQHKRIIILFEEIDSLGNRNHTTSSAADQSQINTLNQFLFEMSNNIPSEILIIGTTNRIESLDNSIKRCGRFDKKIEKKLPDEYGRYKFLYHKLITDHYLQESLDLKTVALGSNNFSYADLDETCSRIKHTYINQGHISKKDINCILDNIDKEKNASEKQSKQSDREEREKELFLMQQKSFKEKWNDRIYNWLFTISLSVLSRFSSKPV